MQALEQKVDTLIAKAPEPASMATDTAPAVFAMPKSGGDFELPSIRSFLKLRDGNILVIALGVIVSATIGGYIARFLGNYAQWSAVVAGALIMYVGKRSAIISDFGAGVMIGGLASVFANLGGMLSGMSGGATSMPMQESRETYGGMDGVYPTQPERRVFR